MIKSINTPKNIFDPHNLTRFKSSTYYHGAKVIKTSLYTKKIRLNNLKIFLNF